MKSLDIAEQIVPGYNLLSEKKQTTFAGSDAGQQFMRLVNSTFIEREALESSYGIWSWLTGNYEQKKHDLENTFAEKKQDLIDKISDDDNYKTLLSQIILNVLKQEFDDFKFLTKEQQLLLPTTEFTKKMVDALIPINLSIIKNSQEFANQSLWSIAGIGGLDLLESLNNLKIEKAQLINEWSLQFQNSLEMEPLKLAIAAQKELLRKEQIEQQRKLLEEHAVKLAAFFPLLNYRKFNTEESIINQLLAKYTNENGEPTSAPEKVDEELLTDLFFHCMHQLNQIEIDFVDLDNFNKKHANRMAVALLKAFNDNTEINLDSWFQDYENKLHKKIIKQMHLINDKPWETKPLGLADLRDSLSFLWNNKTVETANIFMGKVADAHGWLQYAGYGTQNENSYLALLDIYNYGRYYERISETKTILTSLLRPLMPLYSEYKNIALFEKNIFWKTFRILAPIIIVATAIIVTSVILALVVAPLALPELVFTAALAPALISGLALASAYVSVKNKFYKTFREKFYGGPFEIPEFQINERMIHAFGSKEKALNVRNFYIDELKHCDKIEAAYRVKYKNGILNQDEITHRKDNLFNRHTLCFEWYDIQSNKELGFEKTPQIVVNRLQITGDREYKKLQKMVKNELTSFHESVTRVTSDLKETLITHNIKPVLTQDRDATTIKPNYRYGLFKQHTCFIQKAHTEELLNLREQIAPCA